jgi:predicted porin
MKKLLIATAALAMVAGTAQAQSSVTVYGVMDIQWASQENASGSDSAAVAGSLATSRLGFRGTEDLGGGLKANFTLEAQLDPSRGIVGSDATSITPATSKVAGQTFNRESQVELISAQFGSIRIGTTDVTDTANIDAITSQAGNMALIQATRSNNAEKSVRYTTPTFNGVSVQIGNASAQNSAASAETTASSVYSAFIKYEAGKLGLYAGQDQTKVDATYDRKQMVYGAKYDFGVATVGATYSTLEGSEKSTKDSGELKQTRFSVAAPVAALGSGVKAHAVYFKDEGTSTSVITGNSLLATVKPSEGYKLALTKGFSKRTTGYVGYVSTDFELSTEKDTKQYVVGVAHSF